MRSTVLAFAALLALLSQELSAPVTRVIDGDTIEIELDGEVERVRYIGIDTPEMNDGRGTVRELAEEAKAANARLVNGRTVRLELDVEERDRYDRLLAYVWVGDTMVNEALVLSGHAAPYTFPPNVRYVERFIAAARTVRERDGSAFDPMPDGAIAASKAISHVGETTVVCGFVASTRYLTRGRHPTFLNLEAPYPDQALTVVIWGDDRAKFNPPPERAFRDREICVEGEVTLYRGDPQIVVSELEAIRVLE